VKLDRSLTLFENESLRTENWYYRRMTERMLRFLDALEGERDGLDLDAEARALAGEAAFVLAFRGGERAA
jgi:hypothetical protein